MYLKFQLLATDYF